MCPHSGTNGREEAPPVSTIHIPPPPTHTHHLHHHRQHSADRRDVVLSSKNLQKNSKVYFSEKSAFNKKIALGSLRNAGVFLRHDHMVFMIL